MRPAERIAALEAALRAAIQECRRHNSEYQHLTPTKQLEAWEALLVTPATAGDLAPTPPSERRRRR